jgi:predicted permease
VGMIWQDLHLAVRMLAKNPAFATVALLTLALGIGANTAIFHLIDAVLLRSLPVKDPARLVAIQVRGGNHGFGVNAGDETFLTYPLWEQIREHQTVLASVFAWESWGFRLGQGSQARPIVGLWVSGEFFSTLGVVPAKGRLLTAADDRPGCGTPGVVLSYAFWQTEFAGQDSAIGQKLFLEDHPVEIIGVAPREFSGLEVGKSFSVAVPFCAVTAFNPDNNNLTRRDFFWIKVMGRLKPRETLSQVSAEMDSLSPGLIEATVPTGYSSKALEDYRNYRLAAYPAGTGVSQLRDAYATSLWLLLGITALVLLIACANIASLMLARASVREREMAVRLALGAPYWRLARQLLVESLLLGCTGSLLGLLLAGVFSRALLQLISRENEMLQLNLNADWRVLAFVAGVAVLTSVIFGLAPMFRSARLVPSEALKSGGRANTGGREGYSFQRILVAAQISVSMVLLVGALLFVRSFLNLTRVDPGFRQQGVLIAFLDMARLQLPPERYEPAQREMLAQIRSIPQVESAAITTHLPFNGSWTSGVTVDENEGWSKFSWVSPGYLQTLQVPLLSGRDLDDRDTSSSPKVALVSESFVRKFLSGKDPIGRVIRTAPEPKYPAVEYQIIGVVKDTKYENLREGSAPPECYAPMSQFPDQGPGLIVMVRSSAPLALVTSAIRQKLSTVSPDVSMEFLVFQKLISDLLIRDRVLAMLSGAFGLLAALLAMVGLYGVISYLVVLRRAEIGIRMALGASRRNIVAAVLRETFFLLTVGIAVGLVCALALARGAASLLYGIQPTNPLLLVCASALLGAIALFAGFIPAQRAARIDPLVALRYE